MAGMVAIGSIGPHRGVRITYFIRRFIVITFIELKAFWKEVFSNG